MVEDFYSEKAEIFFNSNRLNNNRYIYSLVKNKLKGKTSSEQKRVKIGFFINLDFEFCNDYVSYRRGDTKSRKKILDGGNPSDNYPSIHSAKHGLLESGYLRFSDTFSLAKRNQTIENFLKNCQNGLQKFIEGKKQQCK